MSKKKCEHINFKVPKRPTWAELNISRERLYELRNGCRTGRYSYNMICKAAHAANKDIAEYLIKSVVENKSYDRIEYDAKLGRICVCRTDFYGYRRQFYGNLDCLLRTEKEKAQK